MMSCSANSSSYSNTFLVLAFTISQKYYSDLSGIIIFCIALIIILFLILLETTTVNPRNEVVSEKQVADISDEVGTCWRQLGPRLKITESKIHNIDEENRGNWHKAQALLIVWKQKEGKNATVGHLSDVLEKIGRRSIAEKLLGEF